MEHAQPVTMLGGILVGGRLYCFRLRLTSIELRKR